ncbi:MAG: helix-turn-helix transcriptional regulator, partial [Spirochaetia bacterium]|nr:helix-turn-helix transcriptional regulator [Spirochaetia bacterium]
GEVLAPGTFFFIPPNVSHRFVYPKNQSKSLSIKFSADPEPESPLPGTLPNHPLSVSLETSFRAIFPEDSGEWLRPDERLRILPHLLSALMEIHLLPRQGRKKNSGLVEKIRDFVADTSGRKMTIQSLAKALGYSPGHLSSRFHSLAGLPLKTYIDRERARIAGEFLRYADLPISEIAARLGFSDGLSFSHFCRRNLGKSPRAWRKETGKKD